MKVLVQVDQCLEIGNATRIREALLLEFFDGDGGTFVLEASTVDRTNGSLLGRSDLGLEASVVAVHG